MNSSPFVPLTEHEIERIRVAFQAFSADAEQADRLTRLCDMALASITRPEVEEIWEKFMAHLSQVDPIGPKENPHIRHLSFLGSEEKYRAIFLASAK